jgi:hypothetical protein
LTVGLWLVFCLDAGSCGDAGNQPVSLARNVRPILTTSCAFGAGCHGAPSPSGYVQLGPTDTLLADRLVQGLVDVPSINEPTVVLVAPGDSGNSFIIRKLTGDFAGLPSAPAACGVRMPYGGQPLPTPSIDTLKRWIDDGAPVN